MSTVEGSGQISGDGLVFYVDAGNISSYNGGTTWYDLMRNADVSLVNGPTIINYI